jgi:hypothetical protein
MTNMLREVQSNTCHVAAKRLTHPAGQPQLHEPGDFNSLELWSACATWRCWRGYEPLADSQDRHHDESDPLHQVLHSTVQLMNGMDVSLSWGCDVLAGLKANSLVQKCSQKASCCSSSDFIDFMR